MRGDQVGQDLLLICRGVVFAELEGGEEVLFCGDVVFFKEVDDADKVLEGYNVGFGEEFEGWHVGCGGAESAEDVFAKSYGVDLGC